MNPNRRALLALPLGLCIKPALAQPEPIKLALIEGLSGPFANAGEAVFRNLLWATERINQRGGVPLPGGARALQLVRYDSKGNTEEALAMLREAGCEAKLYTFYGNALGAPAAIGEAGIGQVLAVAEWHPNAGGTASEAFYAAFRQRFPEPRDDYVHVRMQVMLEMLAAAIERAGSTEAAAVAAALEGAQFDPRTLGGLHTATMRATDHQLQQPLIVSVMDRAGSPGVAHDVEGSGFGFRTLRRLDAAAVSLPGQCRMTRPS